MWSSSWRTPTAALLPPTNVPVTLTLNGGGFLNGTVTVNSDATGARPRSAR